MNCHSRAAGCTYQCWLVPERILHTFCKSSKNLALQSLDDRNLSCVHNVDSEVLSSRTKRGIQHMTTHSSDNFTLQSLMVADPQCLSIFKPDLLVHSIPCIPSNGDKQTSTLFSKSSLLMNQNDRIMMDEERMMKMSQQNSKFSIIVLTPAFQWVNGERVCPQSKLLIGVSLWLPRTVTLIG